MKFATILGAAALIGLGACSPGSESGLTKAERAKYEAWMAELEHEQNVRPEMATSASAANAELEELAGEFLAYEASINALLDEKDSMPDADFDAQLAALRDDRAKLVARRDALEAASQRPVSNIRPSATDVTSGTPFMQAASSLSNDHLLFALMSATVTEGPVKRYIDDDLDLKTEIAEIIGSQRTASPDAFRAQALKTLETLDRDIDDNEALIVILKTP